MRFFLDCEWTAHENPRLLSVGVSPTEGEELYLEVSDPVRRKKASSFTQDMVLPQLGLVPAVEVRDEKALGDALAGYLLARPGSHTLCCDHVGDLQLCIAALHAAGKFAAVALAFEFEMAAAVVLTPEAEDLWDKAYAELEGHEGLFRHHALVDARALKRVYTAVSEQPGNEHLKREGSSPAVLH